VNLLLVEDDVPLADALREGVLQHGWQVAHAGDAQAAKLLLADHAFTAVLLDLGLPGESGLALLRWMRTRYDATPVLVITARGQLSERIQGLEQGADDYLVKPFQFEELFARVRALARRSQGRVTALIRCGEVSVDPQKHQVFRAGQPVDISAYEYRTLLALLERPGRVLSRDKLQQIVYGDEADVGSNTIAVFIHQLRRKLGDDIVQTVHGQGYKLGETRP